MKELATAITGREMNYSINSTEIISYPFWEKKTGLLHRIQNSIPGRLKTYMCNAQTIKLLGDNIERIS